MINIIDQVSGAVTCWHSEKGRDQVLSRLSAMQEVCNVAAQAVDRNMINIHGKSCTCEHCNLIRALDKLNEVCK
jgi:hypothetical protein